MSTIGEATSRIRNTIKAVKEDSFITDRFLYSLLLKYGKLFIKREDSRNKLMRMSNLFTKLSCIELIDVDKVEACCIGISTGCLIKRTKEKLPEAIEGAYGPILRTVASIDYSQEIYKTDPETYTSMSKTTTFKYNKNKYYWYIDGYLYFPDLQWDSILIDGFFIGDTSGYTCDDVDNCILRQDQKLRIPEFLLAEIEQMVLKELGIGGTIPPDGAHDNQNVYR
jgi:hypothetical protein